MSQKIATSIVLVILSRVENAIRKKVEVSAQRNKEPPTAAALDLAHTKAPRIKPLASSEPIETLGLFTPTPPQEVQTSPNLHGKKSPNPAKVNLEKYIVYVTKGNG